jgi:hypothetical protein
MGKIAQAGAGRLLVMQEGRLVGLLTVGAVTGRLEVRERLGRPAG